MKLIWIAAALVACSSAKKTSTKEVDRDALVRAIHDQPHEVESVIVEPIGDHQARYVITWLDHGGKDVACAEFPSPLLDELNAAKITYGVKPPDDRDPHEYVYPASLLRADLADHDPDYAKITIHPRADDTARYVIDLRNGQRPKVVYAEYPGAIVDEIKRAGVAFEVTP